MTLPFCFLFVISITTSGLQELQCKTYTIAINIFPGIGACEEEFIGSNSDDGTVLLSQAVVMRMLFSV